MKNERFNQVVAIAVVLGLCVLIPWPSPIEAQNAPERRPTRLNTHMAFLKSEGLHQFGVKCVRQNETPAGLRLARGWGFPRSWVEAALAA